MTGIVYEPVPVAEYKPILHEFRRLLMEVRRLAKGTGLRFQDTLVGSGERMMITRVRNGNGGFDFDYLLLFS